MKHIKHNRDRPVNKYSLIYVPKISQSTAILSYQPDRVDEKISQKESTGSLFNSRRATADK